MKRAALLALTVIIGVVVAMPPPFSFIALLLIVLVGVVAQQQHTSWAALRWLVQQSRQVAQALGQLPTRALSPPEIKPIAAIQVMAEWLLITAVLLFALQHYLRAPSDYAYSGSEAEWLTSSAYAAYDGLQQYGRIPLWQPYIDSGEPLVENPFSFLLNPFSSLPSLILGPGMGIRLSVILTTGVAGLGGWFLAWTLGLGSLARLALAALLIGKGNMLMMFNAGYYQLAAGQAYFPWIVGGVVAMFRASDRRWPYVLTALAWTLQLYAGNLWYTLPGFLSAALVALAYLIARPYQAGRMIPRLLAVGFLTFGLSAAQFIPVAIHRDRIGDHLPVRGAGQVVPLDYVLRLFIDPSVDWQFPQADPVTLRPELRSLNEVADHYYSYTTPLWFILLLFLLPFYRPRWTAIGISGVLCLVLFTLWGAGGQQPWLFLYERIPGLASWRFVGRALAGASFWLAVLLALRIDSLWQMVRRLDWAAAGFPQPLARWLPILLAALLPAATVLALRHTVSQWGSPIRSSLRPLFADSVCLSWLRGQYPDEHLTVWRINYTGAASFVQNRIRLYDVTADFEIIPLESSLTEADLFRPLPRFGIAWDASEQQFMRENGYQPVEGSPFLPGTTLHCLYERQGAFPYTYQLLLDDLDWDGLAPPLERVQEVIPVEQQPDAITVVTMPDSQRETVLTVGERAYPGWRVTVNGEEAALESIGGRLGVILPAGDSPRWVQFIYRPLLFLLGGTLTIITALLSILFLLRGERILYGLPRRRYAGHGHS